MSAQVFPSCPFPRLTYLRVILIFVVRTRLLPLLSIDYRVFHSIVTRVFDVQRDLTARIVRKEVEQVLRLADGTLENEKYKNKIKEFVRDLAVRMSH